MVMEQDGDLYEYNKTKCGWSHILVMGSISPLRHYHNNSIKVDIYLAQYAQYIGAIPVISWDLFFFFF